MLELPDASASDEEIINAALHVIGKVLYNARTGERSPYRDMPLQVAVYPSSYDPPDSMPLVRVWDVPGRKTNVVWEVDWKSGHPVVKRNYRF
jgi:hypothetical protein